MSLDRWDLEEEDILRKLWVLPGISLEEITRVLTRRSTHAVKSKADRLGLEPLYVLRPNCIDFEYMRKLLEVHEG